MSVRGEFQRVLGDCLASLERGSSAPPELWRDPLAKASERVATSLAEAAECVLALGPFDDDAAALGFAAEAHAREFGERLEHLRAICRAIVGR